MEINTIERQLIKRGYQIIRMSEDGHDQDVIMKLMLEIKEDIENHFPDISKTYKTIGE